jgi:hypothetical protein
MNSLYLNLPLILWAIYGSIYAMKGLDHNHNETLVRDNAENIK